MRRVAATCLALIAAAACGGGDDDDDDVDAAVCDRVELAAAADHVLPPGYPARSFPTLGRTTQCAVAGFPAYQTLDLDGDGALDLVIYGRCGDASVGDTRWLIHRGGPGGFAAAAADWTLPAGYPAGSFTGIARDTSCTTPGSPAYALTDLVGDAALDLVVTTRCGDDSVGDTHWRVHAGGPQGFAPTAIDYALPAGYATRSFRVLTHVAVCGPAGQPSYWLGDATGDGKVDLVITSVCGTPAVGISEWRVHPTGASGFGAAVPYALPPGYAGPGFPLSSRTATCGVAGTPTYVTTDLDGDRRFDLLITAVCGDDSFGDTHWRLHSGGAAGFGAATELALPAGYPARAFPTATATPACGIAGMPTHTLVDVDGDRHLDLLIVGACNDDALGTSRWRVHHGDAAGFTAAADLALPGGYPPGAFDQLSSSPVCGPAGIPSHDLADLDGDGRVDLVVPALCGDDTVGTTRWIVHRNRCTP